MAKIIQVARNKIDKAAHTGRTLLRVDAIKQDTEKFKSVLTGINHIRDINIKSAQSDLSSVSFDSMLSTWGIEESQINTVIKNFKLEIMLYGGLSLLTFFSLVTSHGELIYAVSFFIVMPLMLAISLMRYWRIQCLQKKQFIPFKLWIRECYKA